MLDPFRLPEVTDGELVTRYLMFRKWYREDQTIKHEAFIPPRDLELSVTRLLDASDAELWQIGAHVALKRSTDLHGRADLAVHVFAGEQLSVQADALSDNPNHAKVTGWPTDRARQMIVAKRLAATPGLIRILPPNLNTGAPP